MNISMLWDIVVVGALLLGLVAGFKKGFARSVLGLLGAIAALFAAVYLSSWIAEFIYVTFIQQNIINNVVVTLESNTASVANGIQAIATLFPAYVSNSLSNLGYSPADLNALLSSGTNEAAMAINSLVAPIITSLIRIIAFVLLFVILRLLLYLLLRATGLISNLPVVRHVDSLFGGIFGLAQSVIVIYVFVAILITVLPFWSQTPDTLSLANIDNTYVFKYFYYRNPVLLILN